MHQHFLNLDFPLEGWHFLTPLNRRWISRRKKLQSFHVSKSPLFVIMFSIWSKCQNDKKTTTTYSYFDICLTDFSPACAVYKPLYAWLETTSLHKVINCFRQWIFSYFKNNLSLKSQDETNVYQWMVTFITLSWTMLTLLGFDIADGPGPVKV